MSSGYLWQVQEVSSGLQWILGVGGEKLSSSQGIMAIRDYSQSALLY